ncbi:hypothetical protein DMUE_3218 [Dictyocoela muelleri]|nr:hypothetical protein DMUE_3218 [Dictyocoela muelleri]
MIIEIVPDRKIEIMTNLIRKHVLLATTIITDGYPSYPHAARNPLYMHKVVNHYRGFKNNAGYLTNNIENLWFLLKYYVKKRLGVKISYIMSFMMSLGFGIFSKTR